MHYFYKKQSVQHNKSLTQYSFQQLSDVWQCLPNPLLLVNGEGHIVFANQEAQHILKLNFAPTNVSTFTINSFLVSDANELISDYIEDCIEDGDYIERLRLFAQRTDYAMLPVLVTLKPICVENTNYALLTLHIDTNYHIEEQRFKLQQISVEQATDALFWIDRNGQVWYANETACKMLNYTALDISLLHIQQLIPSITNENWEQTYTITRECGSCVFETEILNAKQQSIPIEIVVNYVPLSKEAYLCAYVRNISHRRNEEKQLQEYAHQLQLKNEELAQITYVTAHSLQEPLRTISSFVQLLQQRYSNHIDAQANEFISFTVNGVKQMHSLLQDLTAYATLSQDKCLKKTVNLTELVQRYTTLNNHVINTNEVSITYNNLPTIKGNQQELQQLFNHLIGNAIHYKSEHKPTINISATCNKLFWIISVKDNGIGVNPDYTKKIFKMFNRLQPQQSTGTGMGLAICKKIVEKHGGQIWHEANPTGGSVFNFTLPYKNANNNANLPNNENGLTKSAA